MTQTNAIELHDIHLKLSSQAGEVNILKGINLSIPAGQTTALIGPSGSGKSSLMMVIAGLERPSQGTIKIAGHDITDYSEDRLALFRRDHVGIVFQDFHLVPTMTAQENVSIPLEFSGQKNAAQIARAQLDAVGLSHRQDHYPNQLSGGEQQRVALARAFAVSPTLLLADEPTGNLDGKTGHKIMDLLLNRDKSQKSTLLLITHDPQLAAKCDRTLYLEDGRICDDRLNEAAQ